MLVDMAGIRREGVFPGASPYSGVQTLALLVGAFGTPELSYAYLAPPLLGGSWGYCVNTLRDPRICV